MLVDSHCHLDHLDLTEREGGLEAVLADAQARGITQFLSVAVDLVSSEALVALTAQYSHVYSSVGVHPLQKIDQPVPSVAQLVSLAQAESVVAIGETGLDNFYSAETLLWQRESFVNHLLAAQQTGKPIIIHTRDAREETIALLRAYPLTGGGVMHCFTETWEMAQEAIALGFYISFSGIVTFNSAADLREVVKKVPLDRLLLKLIHLGWPQYRTAASKMSHNMSVKLPNASPIYIRLACNHSLKLPRKTSTDCLEYPANSNAQSHRDTTYGRTPDTGVAIYY